MQFMSSQEVEYLRSRYPVGTRLRCDQMEDPWAPVPPGTTGAVKYIDDAGTIHMKWDNGRTLGLVYGEDQFTVIKEG